MIGHLGYFARVQVRNFFVSVEQQEVLRREVQQDKPLGPGARLAANIKIASATSLKTVQGGRDGVHAAANYLLALACITQAAIDEQF